jgi:hypothetical protein
VIQDVDVVRFLGALVQGENITCADFGGEFDAVMRLRRALQDSGLLANTVKLEEGSVPEVKLENIGMCEIPVADILFCQVSIGSTFRDRRPLDSLTDDLLSARVSMAHPNLRIDVMLWRGTGYISRNNRRMYCFRAYQEHVDWTVKAHAQVWRLPASFTNLVDDNDIMRKFLRNYENPSTRLPRVRWPHARIEHGPGVPTRSPL